MRYTVNVTEKAIQEHPGFWVIEDDKKDLVALVKFEEDGRFPESQRRMETIHKTLNGEFNGATPGGQVFNTERLKQIHQYGFTIRHHEEHPEWYDAGQLTYAARELSKPDTNILDPEPPRNWDPEWWKRMCAKGYEERLTIAGALLIAEYERLFVPRS